MGENILLKNSNSDYGCLNVFIDSSGNDSVIVDYSKPPVFDDLLSNIFTLNSNNEHKVCVRSLYAI